MLMTLTLLAGIWSTTCIQTQITNHRQGFVKETYDIKKDGVFEFKREWFSDSICAHPEVSDIESGTIELGPEIRNIFNTKKTFEANFSTQSGVDLGAVSLTDAQTLKVARGMKNSSMRNSMLGLFEYKKMLP